MELTAHSGERAGGREQSQTQEAPITVHARDTRDGNSDHPACCSASRRGCDAGLLAQKQAKGKDRVLASSLRRDTGWGGGFCFGVSWAQACLCTPLGSHPAPCMSVRGPHREAPRPPGRVWSCKEPRAPPSNQRKIPEPHFQLMTFT